MTVNEIITKIIELNPVYGEIRKELYYKKKSQLIKLLNNLKRRLKK